MNTDPIADLLTRIRNGYMAKHGSVKAPHSKIKEEILKVMQQNDYIVKYTIEEDGKFKHLVIELNSSLDSVELKRVSKPGQRIYKKHQELAPYKNKFETEIISTSKGLMTTVDAYKQKLGGEIICKLF